MLRLQCRVQEEEVWEGGEGGERQRIRVQVLLPQVLQIPSAWRPHESPSPRQEDDDQLHKPASSTKKKSHLSQNSNCIHIRITDHLIFPSSHCLNPVVLLTNQRGRRRPSTGPASSSSATTALLPSAPTWGTCLDSISVPPLSLSRSPSSIEYVLVAPQRLHHLLVGDSSTAPLGAVFR